MEGEGNYPEKNAILQCIDGRSQMRSRLPRYFPTGAHDWGQVLTFEGKNCSLSRAFTGMPMQDRPSSALLDIPEPDRVIKAATGQRASIRAPGHAQHSVRMLRERLETVKAFRVPQLDRAIKARARQLRAIGGQGQSCHPVGMSRKLLHGEFCLLRLPHPDAPIGAAADQPPPIRAPSQRMYRAALTSQRLHLRAAVGVPQPDEGITPAAGEQAPIRSKGHTNDTSGVPACPQQGAALSVPQLDRVIPAPTGQCAFIWAECKSRHNGDVGLPLPIPALLPACCLRPSTARSGL